MIHHELIPLTKDIESLGYIIIPAQSEHNNSKKDLIVATTQAFKELKSSIKMSNTKIIGNYKMAYV